MKKKLFGLLLAIGSIACVGLYGCAGKEDDDPDRSSRHERDKDEDDDDEDEEDDDESWALMTEPRVDSGRTLDYNSRALLLSYLEGTWYLSEKESGEDYAVLRIGTEGECEYELLTDGRKCEGMLSLDESPEVNFPGIHWYELNFSGIEEDFGGTSDEGSSSGYFMIAQAEGSDYLYLEEMGNGWSAVAMQLFCLPATPTEIGVDTQWVFHRDNELNYAEGPKTSDGFYAMVIESGEDGLLLQPMDAVSFETPDEYSGFVYMAALFDESRHPAECRRYAFAENADLSSILHESKLEYAYPMMLCHVITDENGDIEALHEQKSSYYGMYELYPLDQEVEWTATDFTVNGRTYKLADVGNAGNSINDCKTYGDYLIIDAHVNPHQAAYTIFNMRNAWPEYQILGENYIFEYAVWDSFYTDMNTVYDFMGHEIYTVDGTEIFDLSFSEDGTALIIDYWKDDYEDTYEDEIERPECLNAPIFALADFKRNPASGTWIDLAGYAPEDALFMVMVNPPSDDAWDFHQPMVLEEGALDTVYIVALQDDTTISLEDEGVLDVLDKGQIAAYSITVPEGGPVTSFRAYTPDGREAQWQVMTISGKDDIRWAFGGR